MKDLDNQKLLELGEINLDLSEFNIRDKINEVINIFIEISEAKKNVMKIKFGSNLPQLVYTD